MKTCTKLYTDIPFAHRAPKHDGHCKLIHGHNWSFEITFYAERLDENGFVVDFGKLKDLRKMLNDMFDHKLVLNNADPLLNEFQMFLATLSLANIVPIPDCSCEGIAQFVFNMANSFILDATSERARVLRVTVFEDSKNSATYIHEPWRRDHEDK